VRCGDPLLWMGVTWASFQTVGKVQEVIELWKMMKIGVASENAQLRRSTGEIPSGPAEVSALMFSSDLHTSAIVKETVPLAPGVGGETEELVKTLQK